jgi:UDP-glucose:(heptosyl)LPS alpha-1,3-glucosyltransferase
LFVVRRRLGGAGGAEKVARDYAERLGRHWKTELIYAGSLIDGFRIGGNFGPGWLRPLLFARDVDRLVGRLRPEAVLSLERGPQCTVYRAGDGVHHRWIRIKYGDSRRWMINLLNWVNLYLERKSVTSSRSIVANSNMVADDLRAEYPQLDSSRIQVVQNGFDPARFNLDGIGQLPDECGSDAQFGKCALFLGSGFERKGLAWAIHFFAELSRLDMTWRKRGRLWIAGKGRESPYRRLASELGVAGQICFLGTVAQPAELCRRAQIFVLPTSYDAFANSTLEALACGCPVVTTAQNGASEVIQSGLTGWVLNELTQATVSNVAGSFLGAPVVDRREVAHSVAAMTRQKELKEFTSLLMSQLG